MARHTTARRWALALPVTVVAAVAGGVAIPLGAAGVVSVSSSVVTTAPSADSASVAQEAPAAPAALTAPTAAPAASVKGSSAPAKVAVATVVLGSTSNPTGAATVQKAQPTGVPLATFAAPSTATTTPRVLRTVTSGSAFLAVGVSWQRDPSLGPVSVAVRTRTEARAAWSAWTTAGSGENDDRNGTNAIPLDVREGPGLIWTGAARSAEVIVTSLAGRQPVDVKVDLINPGHAASDAAAADVSAATASASTAAIDAALASNSGADEVAQPQALAPAGVPAATALPTPTAYGNGVVKIYGRAAWGANAGYMKWSPAYASAVKAVVVHHTATGNDYQPADVPGIIRSIYYYMAVTEKYGDVGYNVLIDRFGRVWEGRYGGLTRAVVGAHAGGFNTGTAGIALIGEHGTVAVSAAAKEATARYAAFKLGTSKADPTGTVALTGGPSTKYKTKTTVKVATIYPHQNTSLTACPGKYGLAILGWVRSRAKALVAAYKLTSSTAISPVVAKPKPTVAPKPKPKPTVAPKPKPKPKPTVAPTPKPTVAPKPTTSASPTSVGTATALTSTGATPVPAGGLTLFGAGYGHGRGLSQYGAKGAALQGKTAAQIVNFYYPGTALTAAGNPTVRVRLSAIDGGHFTLSPTSGTTVTGVVATAGNGVKVLLPARTGWHVARSGGSYVIAQPVAGGTWKTAYTLVAPVTFSGPSTLTVRYSKAKADCRGGATLTFAGSLSAVVSANTAYYVARMPIDTYLKGVVASEMPSSWPAVALQAQALAARTYATSHLSTSRFYDMMDTQASQCWDGVRSETKATNAAIAATAGKVLTSGGKAINAQFSSDSGGYTAYGDATYLPAKADPYTLAAGSSATQWTTVVTSGQLAAVDGAAGLTTVTAVRVAKRTGQGRWGGRIVTIELIGTVAGGKAATVSVTGAQLRTRLGLKSTYLGFVK